MMKKNVYVLLAAALGSLLLTGCKGSHEMTGQEAGSQVPGTVELVVWGAQEDEELLKQLIASFQNSHQGEADFRIRFAPQGETDCKDALLADLENGADVFTFADDQLNALAAAGGLNPVENPEEIRQSSLDRAVEAASVGSTLYAYPLTADNGYFLYYNKAYLKEQDVATLDRILDVAEAKGKLFTMDWSSAWYVYAFFGNTGMEVGLNQDGITNYCTWNRPDGELRGVDVAQAMLDIAASPAFSSRADAGFLEGVRDGSVIAGVSGVWNAVALEEAWGKDLGAAQLPTYTCRGRQIQMASFSGCKLIGVNAYSDHYQWADRLARWIAGESGQKLRFELRGQGPANIQAAEACDVDRSPAIAALLAQSEFSHLQRIGGNFWDPVTVFGENMAVGNPENQDLQKQLDKMVEGITAR